MGQKTHPKGFRLVSTQGHLSNWYSGKKTYSSLLKEDAYIREKIETSLEELLKISTLTIQRANVGANQKESVHIIVNSLYPRAKDLYRKVLKYSRNDKNLKQKLEKNFPKFNKPKDKVKIFGSYLIKKQVRNLIRLLQLKTKKKISIGFKFFKNQFEDAILLARFIGDQLKQRVPFRRVVKLAIKKVKLTSIKGIKVEISGRLNGVEMARSEWKREGKIPLHTLRASIDYTHQKAETVYGVMGIKVWLFKK